MAEALEILGKPDAPPNFGDLYKVLEIVSKNVTGFPGLKGLPNLKKMGGSLRRSSKRSLPRLTIKASAAIRRAMPAWRGRRAPRR